MRTIQVENIVAVDKSGTLKPLSTFVKTAQLQIEPVDVKNIVEPATPADKEKYLLNFIESAKKSLKYPVIGLNHKSCRHILPEYLKYIKNPEGKPFNDSVGLYVLVNRSQSGTLTENVCYSSRLFAPNPTFQIPGTQDNKAADALYVAERVAEFLKRVTGHEYKYGNLEYILINYKFGITKPNTRFNIEEFKELFTKRTKSVECNYTQVKSSYLIVGNGSPMLNVFKKFGKFTIIGKCPIEKATEYYNIIADIINKNPWLLYKAGDAEPDKAASVPEPVPEKSDIKQIEFPDDTDADTNELEDQSTTKDLLPVDDFESSSVDVSTTQAAPGVISDLSEFENLSIEVPVAQNKKFDITDADELDDIRI